MERCYTGFCALHGNNACLAITAARGNAAVVLIQRKWRSKHAGTAAGPAKMHNMRAAAQLKAFIGSDEVRLAARARARMATHVKAPPVGMDRSNICSQFTWGLRNRSESVSDLLKLPAVAFVPTVLYAPPALVKSRIAPFPLRRALGRCQLALLELVVVMANSTAGICLLDCPFLLLWGCAVGTTHQLHICFGHHEDPSYVVGLFSRTFAPQLVHMVHQSDVLKFTCRFHSGRNTSVLLLARVGGRFLAVPTTNGWW